MESGSIPTESLSGGFDLQSTVESGQTFHWARDDGRTYAESGLHGGSAWYHTVLDGEAIRARQFDGTLEWEATTDADAMLTERLRLDDDLDAIVSTAPDDPLIERALAAYRGMRIVRDPFFRCLVGFICSAQMRVERIFEMCRSLARTYGEAVEVGGHTYHGFPTPAQLAAATEAELRDLGLGYRAPYVVETAELVASGELTRGDIPEEYEAAREVLTGFVGVGEKVADCVCLFSLGHLDAVPLDTWIRTAIEEHFPECDRGSYADTSRAIRERFGPHAGYVQTYAFHYLRHHY